MSRELSSLTGHSRRFSNSSLRSLRSPACSCSSLPPEFAFPASVTKVGNAVLWGTGTALESQERAKVGIEREQYSLDAYGRATFKEDVETIKKVDEEDTEQIKEVIINEGAKVIGGKAFFNCDELTAVSVPSTVVEIGSEAFCV